MFLMIDNYDSFVYNLTAYLNELDQETMVVRNDCITLKEIERLNPEGIIISPGPKNPTDCGICVDIVKHFAGKIPILGVCLGHQIIGYAFGAAIIKGRQPMHGKVTPIIHSGEGIFDGLPKTYPVTRYHSLIIDSNTLPNELQVESISKDGVIMGVSHKLYPIYGVQFHPEAVLSRYGHELLENFLKICEKWRFENESAS
ncbi:Para-aminobenzoate synthase, amidotransferase component [Lachnospiraceae bacterium TWA4]|nr:Para-aminobenzoate synthase, amidotransferase component [Lachnospiraceae bacterium TWA4]